MDYRMLGAMLTMGRIAKGLSQRTVAEQLGVTPQNVSSWERGRSRMDLERYLRLCGMYGLDPVGTLRSCAPDVMPQSGDEQGPGELDRQELQVLTLFRSLSEDGKDFILQSLTIAARAEGAQR